ncbi:MAG: hypothetical protein PUC69_01490 [Ruminococcus sp.]|uniref:Uncharacterized protein n=1 Tax=Ruminococcus bovis TaxID=2564099 RepID=A0A4P8XVT1_9FIRM|nr:MULTISPECIES: hypothetical protein [Ruminococcus]MDD5889275.1 hypothetical protein [Ruminococcus sp.]QCT07216.1 hypothetical protein E5Z56_07530 [Ruminococcus bovis]
MRKRLISVFTIVFILMNIFSVCYVANAEETTSNTTSSTRKYLGETVYVGHSEGYSLNEKIEKDNPHFGWELGNFYVSGFTRAIDENTKNPIFLKNAGDKVTLSFSLAQDISKLNGKDGLTISEDNGGYDEEFGIERTYFGKGMLITRYTDYQGKKHKPVLYKDYLKGVKNGADTTIQLCEEGDYEVTLDYQIDIGDSWWEFWKQSAYDYKIAFNFSVRNGNCMIFPREVSTKNELGNKAFSEKGFYLDFAKSRYLDIDVKKQILNKNGDKLVEDTRFNKPGADGDTYTDEGVYTITAKNRYTSQTTTKVIYVGTDDLLKAYATTQLSLKELKKQMDKGNTINSDGTIKYVSKNSKIKSNDQNESLNKNIIIIIAISVLVVLIIVFIIVKIHRKKKCAKNENKVKKDRVD